MKILSLNGGGTAGYASILFLEYLEKETGKQCYQLFDMIGGVSTGSIQACALSIGIPAARIRHLYEQIIPVIFKKPWYPLAGYFRPKYSYLILNRQIRSLLGTSTMANCKIPTLVYATRLNPVVKPELWRSWDDTNKSLSLADLATASSSAPGYFAHFEMNGVAYIDGGLSTNNPSMTCLAEAVKMTGVLQNDYIVNLNPNAAFGFSLNEARRYDSFLTWAPDIASTVIAASQEADEKQAHEMIGFSNHVVKFDLGGDLDEWDNKIRTNMVIAAISAWNQHNTEILKRLLDPGK